MYPGVIQEIQILRLHPRLIESELLRDLEFLENSPGHYNVEKTLICWTQISHVGQLGGCPSPAFPGQLWGAEKWPSKIRSVSNPWDRWMLSEMTKGEICSGSWTEVINLGYPGEPQMQSQVSL